MENPYNLPRLSVDKIHEMGSVVYFIFAEEELLYIGQSRNFKHRMKMHRVRFEEEAEFVGDMRLKDLSLAAIPVPPECLNDVEYYYIQEYTPPYNKDYMPDEVVRAYRAVKIAKAELVLAQMNLDDALIKYRQEHKGGR